VGSAGRGAGVIGAHPPTRVTPEMVHGVVAPYWLAYRDDEAPRPYSNAEYARRVPYVHADEFVTLTERALSVGRHAEEPHRSVLALLIDCPADRGHDRGAAYEQLAAIAHAAGMSKQERARWYEVARCVPLSEKHASHIIERLRRAA